MSEHKILPDEYIQEMSRLMLEEWQTLKEAKPERKVAQSRQRLKDRAAQYLITVKSQQSSLPDELVILLCEMLDDPARNKIRLSDEWNDEPEIEKIGFRLLMLMMARAMGVRSSSILSFFLAILYEARHDPDPKGENPSSASLGNVAREVKVTTATVRRWRQQENYQEMIKERRGHKNAWLWLLNGIDE